MDCFVSKDYFSLIDGTTTTVGKNLVIYMLSLLYLQVQCPLRKFKLIFEHGPKSVAIFTMAMFFRRFVAEVWKVTT